MDCDAANVAKLVSNPRLPIENDLTRLVLPDDLLMSEATLGSGTTPWELNVGDFLYNVDLDF
jgi:hypothetical protein